MRSGSSRGLAFGGCAAVLFAASGCLEAMFEPVDSAGQGGSGGRGGTGVTGSGGTGVAGSSGSGGSIGGIGGVGGRGGVGGGAGTAGAGGGGTSGSGPAGAGGVAGAAGRGGGGGTVAGTGGRGGDAGVAGIGGAGGTAGVAGGGSGGGGTGGALVPLGVTPTTHGQIVITEMMHDASSIDDNFGEWIEVYNPSPTVTYDLLGCEVRDASPGKIIDTNFVMAPMTFKTLAVSGIPGFTPDFVYTTIVKFDNQGSDLAQIMCGATLIDAFGYPAALANVGGHTFSVDPDHYDAADNDSMANWCIARDTMTGDAYENSGPNYGTPGRANTQCP